MENSDFKIVRHLDVAASKEEGADDIIKESDGLNEIIKMIEDSEEEMEPYLYTGS